MRLVKRCEGGLNQVYFSNSGAEAIEAALKFAVLATGRKKFIACRNGFHGKTRISAEYRCNSSINSGIFIESPVRCNSFLTGIYFVIDNGTAPIFLNFLLTISINL